jgi:hypothetical protein
LWTILSKPKEKIDELVQSRKVTQTSTRTVSRTDRWGETVSRSIFDCTGIISPYSLAAHHILDILSQ